MTVHVPTAVVVVSDGSAPWLVPHRPSGTATHRSDLHAIAAHLRERAGLDAHTALLQHGDIEDLVSQLEELSAKFGVIYLVGATYARASAAQTALGGTASIITDWQTSAITLTAALLTTLTRLCRPPETASVLIIGGGYRPDLAAIAAAAGVGEITTWQPHDDPSFPLALLAGRATVVIDALNCSPIDSASARTYLPPMALPSSIVTLDSVESILAALLTLMAGAPAAGARAEKELFLACARELSSRVSDDRVIPELDAGWTQARGS